MWKRSTFHVQLALSSSRLKNKVYSSIDILKPYVESSGILYDTEVLFDKNSLEQRDVLQLGIAKFSNFSSTYLQISCNLMRQFYLMSIAPPLPKVLEISNFCNVDGIINIAEVCEELFRQLSSIPFLRKESWVLDKINTSLSGPTEKLYQFEFFALLSAMCRSTSDWYPVLEMNRSDGKVDLGICFKNGKQVYLIELGVNCKDEGPGSCLDYYERQIEKYHGEDVVGSVVIMIYTNRHPLFFPKLNGLVQYFVVEHYIFENPKNITLIKEKRGDVIQIALKS
eukprot:TRINITY_DN9696_c0_g1_i2.p1 TRINITY_DN9696_c0_g1~~TRINITY_DN9696_c0_g1_i2.p1  ORF type:complete len:282 (+),score=30.06 TRINITY_DN9696_c0_g1_i2:979-1824(+)